MSSSRRGRARAALASSFVVTVSTLGCSSERVTATRDQPDTVDVPPPDEGSAPPPTAKPTAVAKTPPPPETPSGATARIVEKSGKCTLMWDVQCPPDALCNPPPPQPVDCPKEGSVELRADGQCWTLTGLDCPPMTKCNPPAPRVVDCPAPLKNK